MRQQNEHENAYLYGHLMPLRYSVSNVLPIQFGRLNSALFVFFAVNQIRLFLVYFHLKILIVKKKVFD